MIKDVMVRLDGSSGDDARLAAVTQIARMFEGHITGLFFNVASEGHAEAAGKSADQTENMLFERLDRLRLSAVLRRLDIKDQLDISETALPVVRTADVFVALRPNSGPSEPKDLIENVLFGGGRHLFLAPENWTGFTPLEKHPGGMERQPRIGARDGRGVALSPSGREGARACRGRRARTQN